MSQINAILKDVFKSGGNFLGTLGKHALKKAGLQVVNKPIEKLKNFLSYIVTIFPFIMIGLHIFIIIASIVLIVSSIAFYLSDTDGTITGKHKKISDNILKFEDAIIAEMAKPLEEKCINGKCDKVPRFTPAEIKRLIPYILALTQQESGGEVYGKNVDGDIMQSSESMCNGKKRCIKDPYTSIHYGIKHFYNVWKDVKNRAQNSSNPNVKSFDNMIQIALQSYNFGSGFINYVFQHGGLFSQFIAYKFALDHATETICGWRTPACYGDYMYVKHVLQFVDFRQVSFKRSSGPPVIARADTKFEPELQKQADPTGTGGLVTPRTERMVNDVIKNKKFTKKSGKRYITCYDHRSSVENQQGRACDFTFRPGEKLTEQEIKYGDKLVEYLLQNQKNLGIASIIWQNKIWKAENPSQWEVYSGRDVCKNPTDEPSFNTACYMDRVHVIVY